MSQFTIQINQRISTGENSAMTKTTKHVVFMESDGLSVSGFSEKDPNCISIWVRKTDGTNLSQDEELDSILQRAIITAFHSEGKLNI